MDYALGALHRISHRESVGVASAAPRELAPLAADVTLPEREELLDTLDYLRGRAAPVLGEPAVEDLLGELRSGDRTTRLRAAGALRPAIFEVPRRTLAAVCAAIRAETAPDVLLRLLWSAHPFLAESSAELLAASAGSAIARWDNPLAAGPALALLGEAAA